MFYVSASLTLSCLVTYGIFFNLNIKIYRYVWYSRLPTSAKWYASSDRLDYDIVAWCIVIRKAIACDKLHRKWRTGKFITGDKNLLDFIAKNRQNGVILRHVVKRRSWHGFHLMQSFCVQTDIFTTTTDINRDKLPYKCERGRTDYMFVCSIVSTKICDRLPGHF